jgi:predicted Zn-dependent protease
MVFMAMAGYDPSSTITFWQKMSHLHGGASIPEFLSTHPSDENRIAKMQEFLPEAMKYYKGEVKSGGTKSTGGGTIKL